MSLRIEFVRLASGEGANMARLCRRFGVSRKTGYKWLRRYRASGEAALADHSRRPHRSPGRTDEAMAQRVLELRSRHPAWGGRKLRRRLMDLGHRGVPSASTITEILRRHDRIAPAASEAARPWRRFERPRPNDLWQMDFKGPVPLDSGRACHPLTVLDDHSRYALAVRACDDQRHATVRAALASTFRVYGLPRAMLMDNGTPWGLCGRVHEPTLGYTRLTVWLMRLDVGAIHGRPYHPQTQGKDERFHRTLSTELLGGRCFVDAAEAQGAFDPWRVVYNFERPHEALGLQTPGARYEPSPRPMPDSLPPLEYPAGDAVRKVNGVGQFRFKGRGWKISEAFGEQRIGLRATDRDGRWAVYFGRFHVADLDEGAGTIERPRRHPPLATLASDDDATDSAHNTP